MLLYISGLRREKPSLDLSLTRISPVAALPGGEAVVRNYIGNNQTYQISKINSQGKVTQTIYTCVPVRCSSYITGLLLLGDLLYLIRYNGTVITTRASDGQALSTSTIPNVSTIFHRGSLSNKPDMIPDKQILLLCDWSKGEVFTFDPSTGHMQVRITGLRGPRSASYLFYNHTVFYIVCEEGSHRINVYNQTWDLIRTIGNEGSNDGELHHPHSAIVSDEDTIIISDFGNHRISEFSINGTFLRHLLVRSDGIYQPVSMSYYYPHLWLVYGGKLYRYSLYR